MSDKESHSTNNVWKTLASFSKNQLTDPKFSNLYETLQPSYYIDVNGKEWIILLMPEMRRDTPSKSSLDDGYLYDVKNDKLISFIESYKKDINERFDIYESQKKGLIFKSYVIDNNNHMMYWLICGQINVAIENKKIRKRTPPKTKRYAVIIAFDIKDLKNIKLIYQEEISTEKFPLLAYNCYTMIIIGNTIQFILGQSIFNKYQHYQFNTKTRTFKLVSSYFHSKYTQNITHEKVVKLFENLKIGDWIDARDLIGNFWVAQILDIKDKKNFNDNIDANDDSDNDDKLKNKERSRSMKIKVHYQGWDDKNDEWINIDEKIDINPQLGLNDHLSTSLCSCTNKCHFSQKYSNMYQKHHRIALPKSQSSRDKKCGRPDSLNGVFSKNEEKLIIFGEHDSIGKAYKWGGLYYKHMMNINGILQHNDFQLIVDAFINRYHDDELFVHYNNYNIPKDINQMIVKYIFIPDDHEWTQATHMDKNGAFMGDMYGNHLKFSSSFVLVEHDNIDNTNTTNNNNDGGSDDIFIFSGTDGWEAFYTKDILRLNIKTNSLRRLIDVEYPLSCSSKAVFCKQSQSVHLFAKDFSQHVSISLKSLNSAATVLLEE